jgi:hypothetical protein
MTSGLPLPTFIPQDAWYNLTVGGINPSVAATVPNISYLQPSSTPLGLVDGLVGANDEMLVFLAGLNTELDGGQKWLMWVAASMIADDGLNVFNPWAVSSTPGRWINAGDVINPGGIVVDIQTFAAGGTYSILPSGSNRIMVFVKGGAGATTLNMPASTFVGQFVQVKDANGIAGTSNVTIAAPSIDGVGSFVLVANYASQSFTWNGAEWSAV